MKTIPPSAVTFENQRLIRKLLPKNVYQIVSQLTLVVYSGWLTIKTDGSDR